MHTFDGIPTQTINASWPAPASGSSLSSGATGAPLLISEHRVKTGGFHVRHTTLVLSVGHPFLESHLPVGRDLIHIGGFTGRITAHNTSKKINTAANKSGA